MSDMTTLDYLEAAHESAGDDYAALLALVDMEFPNRDKERVVDFHRNNWERFWKHLSIAISAYVYAQEMLRQEFEE